MLVLLVLSHIVAYAYGSIIEKLSIVRNCVRLLFIVIDTMPLLLSNFSSSWSTGINFTAFAAPLPDFTILSEHFFFQSLLFFNSDDYVLLGSSLH